MKFLTLALLAVFNIWMVCARPDYSDIVNQTDGKFNYWVSWDTLTATVMGVKPAYANTNTLTLNPTLKVQGKTFTITQIGAAAFSNNNVKNLIVPSSIKKINISPRAFFNSYIESIDFRCKEVTLDGDLSFEGCNKHALFKGDGVPSLVTNYAKYLLKQWNLPVDYQGYTDQKDSGDYKRVRDLYTLAKNLKTFIEYNEGIAHGDSAASALVLRAANSEGIARAFNVMARVMGVPPYHTEVGFDGKYYRWNYVKVIKDESYREWYNVDIVHYNFGNAKYSRSLFKSVSAQKNILKNAYNLSSTNELDFNNWKIYDNVYNYPGEWTFSGPFVSELYSWLVRNRACCFHE
eukprot:jgi/Orpsp1_1/1179754/evm.model.c7180000070661.1